MKIQLSDHFSYKKLMRFVVPSITMMVFTSIYGVIDGLFVSNYVGKTPFASLNLIMPFIMILGGMGFMIGAGGTALVAKVLGTGDRQKANRYFSILVMFTVLLGAVLTTLGIVFIKPVAYLLGATPDMIDYCVLYGTTVISFTTAFMLQNVFQSFLTAAEKPKLGLAFTVAAGVINALLDWLFMGVFNMGLFGAALATGIGQCIGGLLPMVYFILPNDSLLRFRLTAPEFKPILKACTNGASELMGNISSSIVGMLYNIQLIKYLGEDGISAYGVIMYVMFIFIAVFIGYSIGSAPIVSFHYGAEDKPELKNLLKKSTVILIIAGIAMASLGYLLSGVLAQIFVGYDTALCEMTKNAFRVYAIAFTMVGLNMFASGFFTALGNGAISAIVSFARTLVFQASAIMVLPLLAGGDAIWWAMPISEVGSLILSFAFILAKRKKYGYM